LLIQACISGAVFAQQSVNQPGVPVAATNSSVTEEKEAVHSVGVHHYQNPAQEAQDALLITQVKTALATDGVTSGDLVEVDCDHGVARLSGVVASKSEAAHAAQIAAGVSGVVGVDNQLTWK
jgi:osmotically-inducible protein OsmY